MDKSKGFSSIIVSGATVFLASACVMVLELVAGRLVARHLGSSLYTWTSVIGVVLAGITIGNYIGGRIADRFEASKSLAVLFAVCSAACVLTIVLNNTVSKWVFLWYLSWPWRVFSHISIVFLIPSILLGTISPVVAKMALERGLPTGRTVGDIYACGAAGSIAGTFLAGFYLIAAMGTIAIIWMVGAVLLLMAIFYAGRSRGIYVFATLYACALFIGMLPTNWCRTAGAAVWLREKHNPQVLYEDETQYCYVKIERVSEKEDKRSFIQDRLVHSSIVMSNPSALQYPYEQIMAAVTGRFAKDKSKPSFLVIGGGGYVLPRYLEEFWPAGTVDVAEIDPGVTEAAVKAFGLSPMTKINTISLDARNFVDEALRQSDKRYDFIYEDALNHYSVPFQLTTREFNEKLARLLTDDGIYMVELIDIFDKGLFLGAFVNTLEQTFPFVSVISTRGIGFHGRNTFVVIATKHKLDLTNACEDRNFTHKAWYLSDSEIASVRSKANGIILTDDFAPVDNLLAAVSGESSQKVIAKRYIERGEKYQDQGQMDAAMAEYRKVLKIDQGLSIKAYNNMAVIQMEQGKLEEAVESLKKAIELIETTGIQENSAALQLNLGAALSGLNRREESMVHLRDAEKSYREMLVQDPNSAPLWADLGNTLAEIGDFNDAGKAFSEAVKLDPGNPVNYRSLAVALELQKRYDEANVELNKGYRFMREHNLLDGALELQKFIDDSESRRAEFNKQ